MRNEKRLLKDCLFLFDIDGTILNTRGDGKKAFYSAFEELFQVDMMDYVIDFRGGIDNLFFKELLNFYRVGLAQYEHHWQQFSSRYTEHLDCGSNAEGWEIFRDSEELISYLKESSQIALVTGNMESGARVKLNKAGLGDYFSAGGYGDRAESRDDLVRRAIEDAVSYHGKSFSRDNIYLIGDTKIDIKSAINNRIVPILVDHYRINSIYREEFPIHYYNDFASLFADIKG